MQNTQTPTPSTTVAFRTGAVALAAGASVAWAAGAEAALITQTYNYALADTPTSVTIGAGSPAVATDLGATPPIFAVPQGGAQFPNNFSYGIGFGTDTLGTPNTGIVGALDSNSLPKATELSVGSVIGPLASFLTNATSGGIGGAYFGTKASSIKNSPGSVNYIGLRFYIDGTAAPLYGYATIIGGQGVDAGGTVVIPPVLQSITYDDTGAAVTVPEPASLGLLALGAAGLVGLRRRRIAA